MKITFPILTLSRGGAQRMLVELANRLEGNGFEVTVLMPPGSAVEYELRCPLIHSADQFLAADDFPSGDIILSNYYTTVPVSQQASSRGKGLHIRLSLCYEPTFLPDNSTSFASYNIPCQLMVLSHWQQDTIRLNHGIKGRIVPIGVDTLFTNQRLRERGPGLIVSAMMRKPEGGFSDHREQDYLLDQLVRVKEACPEAQLRLIVPPSELADSPALQALLYDTRFQIRTPADDAELCYYYNETDIFVSSSLFDSGSLPGLEAMRCGAALVTLYAGGNQEYCKHGHNCLMSYRHENRLADDVITLIRDKKLRQRLAGKGERDSYAFSWERSAQIFKNHLYEIKSHHP